MKGYREIESSNAEVKIYISEDIKLKETDVIEDITSNIYYKIVEINKTTEEEETKEGKYEIEACYDDKYVGYTYKEFLEECIQDIESSIHFDVGYSDEKDTEIVIEEILITIDYIITKK